jgi:hypothetical protein
MTGIPRTYQKLTVASGQTTSGVCDCTRFSLVGVYTPGELTSTSATLEASVDGSTWVTVMQVGGAAAESATVAASKYVPLTVQATNAIQRARIVCGSAEGADREFICVTRPLA